MRVMLDGTEIGDGTINFFPRALVDQSVSRTYTVTNLSDATLNLVLTNAPDAVVFANGTMSENGFTITSNITGDSTNLVPGASASFTVNFQSSEVGEKSATIKIFNSNPVTPLYSFEVMAIVGEYAWVTNSSGNWSTNANWSGGFIPNNAGVVVNFTNNITAARSVTNDTISRTVGTLNIGDANNTHGFTLAAGSGTSLTLDNWGAGAAINETGSVVDTISAPLILAENLTCTAAGSLTISGIIAETNGVRSLTKAGSGTLTLSSSGNTYTGPTTVSAGTLAMTTANRISSSSKISIGGGSTFAYSSGADSSFFLASGQAVEGTGTGVATFNTGNNSGNGLVTVDNNTFSHTGSGTLKFQRLDIRGMNNMLTGGNVEAGVSSSRRGLLVGNTSAGTFTLSAGTFTSLGEISTFSDVIGVNGVLGTFNISGGNYVNAGLLAFGIGTTAHRGGTLNINSGTATIGTLLYDSSTATGNQGIVNLNGGTLTVGTVTYASGTTREFNFNGGQLVANGNLTFSSSLTHNVKSGGAKIDTSDKTVTVNGALVNSGNGGGLTKTGSGTLVLAGENTYTGLTTIATGTLKLAKTNAIHDASAFVLGAATLDADIYTDTVGTLDVTAAATINLGSGGALVFADSSGVNNGTWAGTLNIIGTFVPGSSIKFGSNSGALTSAQLSRISVNNSVAGAYTLNAGGYLISKGTLFMFF
jgi:autotransporter-associated beta strand protein